MRCKKHLTDFSSSVGVCASCLRERLFILVAAQAQDDRRNSDSHLPPPLLFPRSVSPPYVCHQNSDWNRPRQSLKDQLFFSTPQVGPTRAYDINSPAKEKVKSTARFSLFSRLLFRSKARKKTVDSDLNSVNSSAASTGSWFSNMLSGHRKKQSTAGFGRRIGRNRDRGMSPARVSDYVDEADWFDGSSAYSSASSRSWWQTPRRAASRHGAGGRLSQSRSGNISGMTFCLSPLVRASPSRNWNQKGVTPEMAFSGEIRFPVNLSTAAAFCANRSRKLADFGRSNHNH